MKQKVTINEGGSWLKKKPEDEPVLKDQTVDFATNHATEEKERQKEVKINAAKKKHPAGKN